MSWEDQAKAMTNHGCGCGGIYSHAGDLWGQVGMDKVSKDEVEKISKNIKEGNYEMTLEGKKCVVMGLDQGHSMTGKTKGEEGEERRLWHCVLGKNNCLYMAGAHGAAERRVVDCLEEKFKHLKEY